MNCITKSLYNKIVMKGLEYHNLFLKTNDKEESIKWWYKFETMREVLDLSIICDELRTTYEKQ